MKFRNKKDHFYAAVNNIINNDKLYNSIIKLQNELVMLLNHEPKVVAIVAPIARSHSSLMAKAISEVYAHNNEKTLLIDLDMHEPTLDKIYNLNCDESAENSNENTNKAPIKINDYLDVAISHTKVYQAKFLVSDEFKKTIELARTNYNHVIILLPPVLENHDILLLKNELDAIVLSTKKEETLIKDIEKSIEFFKINKLPYVGTIIIN